MGKIALYRKYRPNDFTSIYGQKSVVQTLLNSVKYNRINHAYIFAGNKGSGKTSIAKILSKAVNCLNLADGNPCNKCENCRTINNNTSMDIIELDAASNSGINEIKNIIDSVVFMPAQLKYKVYIIDEAHMLTTNSWNALLKTLEEPPSHTIIIFATTEYHKIPPTIVSRCQRYDFHKISQELLSNLIIDIAQKEDIKIDQSSIDIIVCLANGAARDALSILDQLANFSNNNIDINLINEMFGLLDIATKIKYLNAILDKQINEIIEMINYFFTKGINFNLLLNDIIQILMDKMIFTLTNNSKLIQILDENTISNINCNDTNKLLNFINIYNEAIIKLKTAEHPKFIFEYISLLACNENSTNMNEVTKNDKPINKWENLNKIYANNKQEKQTDAIIPDNNNVQEIKLPATTDNLFKTSSRLILEPTLNKHNNNPFNLSENGLNQTQNNEQTINLNTTHDKTEYVIRSKDDQDIDYQDIYSDNYKQAFFAIASNNDKDKKASFNQILSDFKEMPIVNDPSLNAFLHAEKFLVTSNNGAVLLFKDEAQVIRFNKIVTSETFIDFFKQLFKCHQLVIGVYKLQALGLKKEYENLVTKDFKDVKINNVLNENKKTILLDILNSKDNNDNNFDK